MILAGIEYDFEVTVVPPVAEGGEVFSSTAIRLKLAQGDVVGMTIVIEGAAAISNLARALLARGAGHICLLGGLHGVYPPYLDLDVKRALVKPEADAMDGAIMMARRHAGLAARWR